MKIPNIFFEMSHDWYNQPYLGNKWFQDYYNPIDLFSLEITAKAENAWLENDPWGFMKFWWNHACKRIHVNLLTSRKNISSSGKWAARSLGLVAWDLDIWDVYREFPIYTWARKKFTWYKRLNIKYHSKVQLMTAQRNVRDFPLNVRRPHGNHLNKNPAI